jgi:putative nucleotidyltransferase with HDIG domain
MLNTGEPRVQVDEIGELDNCRQVNQGREWVLSIMARVNEIAGIADSSAMVQGILDLMLEVTLAGSAQFFQFEASGNEFVITHVCGDAKNQHLVGLRLNRQQGLPGMAICDPKIMVVGDLLADPDWRWMSYPVNSDHKKNVINLPVVNKDQAIGMIQIFDYQVAEAELLVVLSKRLAIEIERRKEIETLKRSNQRLLTLVDILGETAGTLDRNQLLHLVTENAARLVNAERSSLFLVDPNTNEMLFQVAYQTPDQGQAASSADLAGRSDRYPGSYQAGRRQSNQGCRANGMEKGEFSYFNQYAITVPIESEPLSHDRNSSHKHTLGGLMVMNKPNAAFQEEDAQLMRILANQASTFLQLAEMVESSAELFLGIIKSLVTAMDAYDPYTQGHSQRVSDYCVLMAQELGIEESLVNDLRIGSLLHDIGKFGIPDSILLKSGPLEDEEMELVKEHPRTGVNILSQVRLLESVCPAILEHHERLDGSGYPAKLKGKQISWMGRIVAVADVFDAMTSMRPYRKALSAQEALAYLKEKAGILFDSACIRALDKIINEAN